MTIPATYSRDELRTILTTWHADSQSEHPLLFPGPLAAKDVLTTWLEDVRQYCVNRLNLHQWQWSNAVLSWIPSALNGEKGFREELLEVMKEKRRNRELLHGRFWEWNDFKQNFDNLCLIAKTKRYVTVGAIAVGSGILIPAVGVVTLAAAGFTAGGVAAGSMAAAIQSAVYGGATGGVFSILQGIGASGTFPVAANFVAAAFGARAAADATALQAGDGAGQRDIRVGDIGDDP